MAHPRISMRWWLALAFALIAAVTAVAVAQVFSERSAQALRQRSETLAVGTSVAAADAIVQGLQEGTPTQAAVDTADTRRISLFVFDGSGELVSPSESRKLRLEAVPDRDEAIQAALDGQRFISTFEEGRATVVALPLYVAGGGPAPERAVLLTYVLRPELAAEFGIVRDKIVEAALLAVLVGAAAGLLVSFLITARLRRIASAAADIEAGNFEQPLNPGFHDELGELAATLDQMRERLRESFARLGAERDRLERLLGRLQDGVVTVNRELLVEFANPTARRLLESPTLTDGDPLPEPWPDFSLQRVARSLFVPGAPVSQARLAIDDERTCMVVGIPASEEQDTVVLVIADISERERRERAEREFVTNAAHELRTPLAAITSSVEVLQAGAKDDPEERDRFLTHVERETMRLGRLVRALLTLARAQTREEAPRLEPVELAPLLEDIARGLKVAEGVDVEVDCASGLTVLADPDLAEQALSNLALNAAKHTEEGRILLTARSGPGRAATIEVVDTGPGIPAAEQERVFDRFYRSGARDRDGFGLGLTIAQQAVRALGGTIQLESVPERGTTVRILLSTAEEEAA